MWPDAAVIWLHQLLLLLKVYQFDTWNIPPFLCILLLLYELIFQRLRLAGMGIQCLTQEHWSCVLCMSQCGFHSMELFKAQKSELGTGAKYLSILITHDLLVVYMVLSHEQNKQRSSMMKRLFKGHSPKAFKLQSERKGCLRTLKYGFMRHFSPEINHISIYSLSI